MRKNKPATPLSSESVHAMLEYLHIEAEQAETVEDLASVLNVIKTLLSEAQPMHAVQGLPNIRAEVMPFGQSRGGYNFASNVPETLISTFYDLSDRMNQLQVEDPETFVNASNALHWLANNDKCVN